MSNTNDSTIVLTTISKKSQLPNTHRKNRSKKRKHNREFGRNNNTSQLQTYFQYNKSRSTILKTRSHPRRANQMEKRDEKQACKSCSPYRDVCHSLTRCYLVLVQDNEWISEDNREILRGNIEVLSFKKKVDDFRASQKSVEDWWCKDGSSSQDKKMGRVLALLDWDIHSYNSENNYSLLYFATSVHVFHYKNMFTNLRKDIRGQGLLYGTETITIEGSREISSPLKIGNRTAILILEAIAYISYLLLNLVSLACFEDEGYKWHN